MRIRDFTTAWYYLPGDDNTVTIWCVWKQSYISHIQSSRAFLFTFQELWCTFVSNLLSGFKREAIIKWICKLLCNLLALSPDKCALKSKRQSKSQLTTSCDKEDHIIPDVVNRTHKKILPIARNRTSSNRTLQQSNSNRTRWNIIEHLNNQKHEPVSSGLKQGVAVK